MPFEQAFKFSAVLLSAVAFVGLFLARGIPAWLAMVTTALMLLTLMQTTGWPVRLRIKPSLSASSALWNGLLISAFLLFLVDVSVLSQELLPAGVHFLVILLGIKLVTLHERRDYRQLYAICLMAILASAALMVHLDFSPLSAGRGLDSAAVQSDRQGIAVTCCTGKQPTVSPACFPTNYQPVLLADERDRSLHLYADAHDFLSPSPHQRWHTPEIPR
jgi:hypothetical protein